jgi:naphthalene 1,2-dioxygenase system ferredoxin subunit
MSESRWIDVMAADDLPRDDVIGIEIAGHDIAIYTAGDQVYATENICTHGQARLSDGFLEGCEIECPLHQGRFDVRDGKPLCEPVAEALRSYAVKIESGRVLIRID